MIWDGVLRGEVAEAGRVLARLGLVTAFGHVSARAGDSMLITPAADLAGVTAGSVIEVAPARDGAMPAGAPAEAWAHLALYPGPAGRDGDRPGPAGRCVRGLGRGHGDGPGARAGRVARRIGAGVRRRRAAQVPRSGRTGGILPPGPRGAAAARQRSPHPGRRSRAGGDQDAGLPAAACDVYLAALSASGAASRAGPVTTLSGGEIASWRAVGGELLPRLWEHLRSGPGSAEPGRAKNRARASPATIGVHQLHGLCHWTCENK